MNDDMHGKVSSLKIGGNNRGEVICGGHTSLPFLLTPYRRPLLALEIFDVMPQNYNDYLRDLWSEMDFMDRLKKAESYLPDLLCLRLNAIDPDLEVNQDIQTIKTIEIIEKVKVSTSFPLIIIGCGNKDRDEEFIPLVSDTMKGEYLLLGIATEENYKILTVSCLANCHSLIAETPLDVNLAKQLNILISDLNMPVERIAMHHATGALGYGLEYCYSIIEKCRLSALEGDLMLSPVMLNFIGKEVWNTKEAQQSKELGINWEVTTGIAYLEAGADILVLAHPESLNKIKRILDLWT